MSEQNDNNLRKEEIFQRNLSSLRILSGLSVDELAGKLNISKQTLYNLENMSTRISTIQYIAIRSVLECIANSDGNEVLIKVLATLLDMECDEKDSLSADEVQKSITTIAAAAATGISVPKLLVIASSLIPTFGIAPIGVVSIGAIVIGKWIKDICEK